MDYLPIKIFNYVNLDAVFTNHFEYPWAIILNFRFFFVINILAIKFILTNILIIVVLKFWVCFN